MTTIAISFIQTLISLLLSLINLVKGPVALVVGVILIVFLLASPAEAAVIQCNVSGCPPVTSWWGSLEPRIKHGVMFWAFAIPTMLYFIIEDMVKRAKEEKA